jgi:transglutaminase-like putative cysteine protease
MATSQPKRPSFFKRNLNRWNGFFGRGDLTGLVIVAALLLVPLFSLKAADWEIELPVVVPATVGSVVLGLLLARTKFGELMALLISSIYGLCLTIMLIASTYEGGLIRGIYPAFDRLIEWLADVTTGGNNQDQMVFTLLVSVLFWYMGYNAAWHVFRVDRIWRVVISPGLILITNNIFYDGDSNIDSYVVVYLFVALLLVVRSNLNAQEWHWYSQKIHRPRQLRRQFLWTGALLAIFPLMIGARIPSTDLQDRLDKFQEFLQSDPIQEISEFWNRMLAPGDTIGPATTDYYGGDSLNLGGSIRLGDQEVFLVDAPQTQRYYWRSRVFDRYESGRWTPVADVRLTDSAAPTNLELEPTGGREAVQQTFTMLLGASRILYTAPQPLDVSLATYTDLFYTEAEDVPGRTMSVSVIRPTNVVRRGESYTATSLVSTATAAQLRQTGTDYPQWVNERYLYVSPSVTPRTIELAAQVVTEAGAVTSYDKAKAIERYLRANIAYSETIPMPPNGQDPIDWVLFDQKEGYCNYYASSMIIMLRSQGVPARMAAGFAQGTYDAERGVYVVTERDAHTWVEVYFPGYGWVEFEPTAAQAPLDRQDEESPPPVDQVTPTPTVTPSPTPLPTSTPLATPTAPGQDSDSVPPEIPTLTPTVPPTVTATPVIVPTQPMPLNPEPNNPIEVILPALGVVFLGVALLVLLVLVILFIWWWWEWRGMGNYGPVSRAYARLERYIGLLGVQLNREETTEERRKRIVQNLPQSERPVTAITRLYMRERYGRPVNQPGQVQHNSRVSEHAWEETRRYIIRRWLRRRFKFWDRGE